MSTIQTLTTEQIEQYQRLVDQQGINAVPGIYAALNNMGFGYAGWCYGVSTGDSVTGMGALDFMQETALRLGTTISPEKVDQIRVGMLNGYLSALLEKADANGGFVNEEIDFPKIREFHIEVFIANGLSIDYWTLETPMKIIMDNFGLDVLDQKWQELTETNGTGADALLSSLVLVDWVTEASYGTIYLDQDNHLITRSELLLHPELRLQITQTKDVSAYSDDAEEWLARLSLGGVGSLGHYIYKQFFGEDSYWVVGDQNQSGQNDMLSVPSSEDVSYVYGLGGKDKIMLFK
ncbi:hypothetical protein [Acinetobacter junii]|uniref:hypothetical protein n=1 Tax=Acinetobacter junii TaxID=40215 RepID=UPI003A852F1D